MALPRQVQEHNDAADEAFRNAYPQPTQETSPAEKLPEDENEVTESETGEELPTGEAGAATEEADDSFADELALMQQRYKTLQGMWQSSEARLKQAMEQIEELKKSTERKKEEPAAPPPALSERDVEAFGADLVEMVRRGAAEAVTAREAEFHSQLDAMRKLVEAQQEQLGDVSKTTQRSTQTMFYADLDRRVPDWRELQATPAAQKWLGSNVPGTQFAWNDVLQDAAARGDASRAAEVFSAFAATQPVKEPTRSDQRSKQLQKQVAPGRSGAGAATPTDGVQFVSSSEFQETMNKVMQLNKQRKYDEAKALEETLNRAMAEGRVLP